MKKRQIRKNMIDPKQAARHAASHLHIGVFTNTPGITTWRGANLGDPTTIYDLNGQQLFYDFPVLSPQREQVGTIRTSASRILGIPVPTAFIGGPRWHTGTATLRACKFVEGELKGKIIDSRPVCYAYPKLGIEIKWESPGGRVQRTIMDVGDDSVVPKKVKPEMRGQGLFPVYENIPEESAEHAIDKFKLYEKLVDELQERAGMDLAGFLGVEAFHAVQTSLIEMISFFTSKTLGFCTHGHSHECFRLHPQETGSNCVPATWQMILDFWRYYYSQSDVAAAMGTDSYGTITLDITSGEVNGLDPNFLNALESFICDHFVVENDENPTFVNVKNEIDKNRPFDCYYFSHSTACAGYRQVNFHIFGTIPEESVYLYDPHPVNTGAIRWETFGGPLYPWGSFKGCTYLKRPRPAL